MPIDFKGKEYTTVAERMVALQEEYGRQGYSLTTEILSMDETYIVAKATLNLRHKDLTNTYTGHAEMARNSRNDKVMENAETTAIGRALASAGWGGDHLASAEEMQAWNASQSGGSAPPPTAPPRAPKPTAPTAPTAPQNFNGNGNGNGQQYDVATADAPVKVCYAQLLSTNAIQKTDVYEILNRHSQASGGTKAFDLQGEAKTALCQELVDKYHELSGTAPVTANVPASAMVGDGFGDDDDDLPF